MNQVYCKECEICFNDETLKNCRNCNNDNLIQIDPNFLLCPVCGCKDLYIKKNFNQALGCLIIIIGAVFVPLTYGLSLLALALVDFVIYKKISNCLQCYKCKLEFKNAKYRGNFMPFDHHIAEIYEK